MDQNIERVEFIISGNVQGVGFRYFVYTKASALGLDGYAKNLSGGNVEAVAEGPAEKVNTLLEYLKQGNSYSTVEKVKVNRSNPKYDIKGFHIRT